MSVFIRLWCLWELLCSPFIFLALPMGGPTLVVALVAGSVVFLGLLIRSERWVLLKLQARPFGMTEAPTGRKWRAYLIPDTERGVFALRSLWSPGSVVIAQSYVAEMREENFLAAVSRAEQSLKSRGVLVTTATEALRLYCTPKAYRSALRLRGRGMTPWAAFISLLFHPINQLIRMLEPRSTNVLKKPYVQHSRIRVSKN